jgi:hypothetical protein
VVLEGDERGKRMSEVRGGATDGIDLGGPRNSDDGTDVKVDPSARPPVSTVTCGTNPRSRAAGVATANESSPLTAACSVIASSPTASLCDALFRRPGKAAAVQVSRISAMHARGWRRWMQRPSR